jgi:lipopolysaccharide export LptBFGC system permease protein LptF
VIGFSLVPVVAITILLELPPLYSQSFLPDSIKGPALVTLIPQALTVAIPVGVMLGILFGLRSRTSSRRLRRTIVVLAVICSVGSFANLAWIVPAANQSFRMLIAERLGADPRTVQKGPNQLTLDELGRQIQSLRDGATAAPRQVRQLETSYYGRWALTFAPFALTLFALSAVRRPYAGRLMLSIAACAACFGYYALLYLARALGLSGEAPAFLVAWLPNGVIGIVATLATVRSTRSPKLAQ